jgi:hypothetical protein
MKQGLKVKEDFGDRGGWGLGEGRSQQAFGDSIVAGVKGGQDLHLLRRQAGNAPLGVCFVSPCTSWW